MPTEQQPSAIRAVFPLVAKLDGETLPAAIGFDVEEKTRLPASLPSHIPEVTLSLVHGFLKAFYDLFDSDNRQGLVPAYHDHASFSLSISQGPDAGHKGQFAKELLQESRNLLRVRDAGARTRLLKQGKISVVAALTELPSTQHLMDSFLVDVPFFSDQLIVLVLNGVLIENRSTSKQFRAFCRHLTIVPQGDGYVVTNDMLLLANASYEQRLKYRSSVTDSEGMREEPATSTRPSAVALEVLTTRLRQQTGMNEKFSLQCLSESAFDFDKALQMFQLLNSQGRVPPDAFVH